MTDVSRIPELMDCADAPGLTAEMEAELRTLNASYRDATDAQVLANYSAACATEVAAHDAGQPVAEIVSSTCDEWMREGMRRGIL
jgi:hypothetical protein